MDVYGAMRNQVCQEISQHIRKRLKLFGKKSQLGINVYKTIPILLPMNRNNIKKKSPKMLEVDVKVMYLFPSCWLDMTLTKGMEHIWITAHN